MEETAGATPFLNGRNIYLREVRPSDVNGNYYSWMNDAAVTGFLESRFYPNSVEKLREYVEAKLGDRNNVFLAIVLRQGDKHIGNIKLGPIDWIHRVADIGLIIGEKTCWGKGYATEAITLVTEYAFHSLNLHKVTAGMYADNVGSSRAFQKAGFEIEGIRKKHYFSGGKYTDALILGRVYEAATD